MTSWDNEFLKDLKPGQKITLLSNWEAGWEDAGQIGKTITFLKHASPQYVKKIWSWADCGAGIFEIKRQGHKRETTVVPYRGGVRFLRPIRSEKTRLLLLKFILNQGLQTDAE